MKSLENTIISIVRGHGRGYVFTPKNFSALGSSYAIGMILMRLCRKGIIRRLARGLYEYPRKHPKLGILSPSIDAVARALQGRDSTRLQPSGAYAANLLGISTQVPMKIVFLTDGPFKHVQLGRQEIFLKHTTPRNIATAGRISGLVIQALRYLGKRHVDDSIIMYLKGKLSDSEKEQIVKDMRYAPAWIAEIMKKIASPNGD